MKRNILFVIENAFWGGGESAFARIINGIDKDKYRVFAACLPADAEKTSRNFVEEIEDSARVIPYDLRNQLDPGNISRLTRIIEENEIDLVHSQGSRADFFSRAASSGAKRTRMVSTIAAPVEEFDVGALKKAVYVALDRLSERWVDRFIVVADHLKEKLIERHGVPERKVVRIYNGIDAAKYVRDPEAAGETRRKLGLESGVPLAGVVGRLVWEKGHTYLLEAAKEMKGNARFLIVGAGGLEAELKAQAKRLKLDDRVTFAGFVDDIRGALNALDVLVVSSLREGLPIVLLEAMALGKPVVASDIEGVREGVIDRKTGLLVPPKDPKALAAALKGLLEDRIRAEEMGRAGREMVREKFDIGAATREHERLYEAVLAEGGGA